MTDLLLDPTTGDRARLHQRARHQDLHLMNSVIFTPLQGSLANSLASPDGSGPYRRDLAIIKARHDA